MPRLIGSRKWLVVFVKASPDDETLLNNLVKRIEASLKKKPLHFEITSFADEEREALRKVGAKVGVEGEVVVEGLNEALINNVLDRFRDSKFQRVAVVFSRNDFGSEEAFLLACSEPFFNHERHYAICWRRSFINLGKKLDCLSFRCGNCMNKPNICEHSCLPQLIYLLFNEDGRVRDKLSEIVKNGDYD